MKICAVICEYNPFHNGHKFQIDEMKRQSGCDAVLCLMSGNFTQRGEAALFDKFTRASHAVKCGADIVLELPAPFALSPAEIFAKGAVHLLSSIPEVSHLAFGCESGNKSYFLSVSSLMGAEDKKFKALLKENMKDGTSYIRARNAAILALHPEIDERFISSPNNILGIEYVRALQETKSNIEPLPIQRVGGGYKDEELLKEYSSATSLRRAILESGRRQDKLVKANLPQDVYADLDKVNKTAFETCCMSALVSAPKEEIAGTVDCSEGLENRLKAMAASNPNYFEMLSKIVSKRYTLSRLKRILTQNLLKIQRKEVLSFLTAPLYLKVLAVKADRRAELFSALEKSPFAAIVRKSDALHLSRTAQNCFDIDVRAMLIYNILNNQFINPYETLFL